MKAELCSIDQIKDNQIYRFILNDHDILLIQQDNDYFAIANQCPHFGVPLLDGSLLESSITCKEHGIRFNLKTGEQLNRHFDECDLLKIYTLIVEAEKIFIEL